MIVTICALVASVGAVLAAYKISSSKTEKVIVIRGDRAALGKEYSALSKALVGDLTRIETATLAHPSDLDFVTKSLEKVVLITWSKDGYYYNDFVVPFINVLRASNSLERENPSADYMRELKYIVGQVVPECSEAAIRGETGEINSFTYGFMRNCLGPATHQLERLNRKRISAH